MCGDDDRWFPAWESKPDDERDVAVLVVLRTGGFEHDIGRYYASDGPSKGWSIRYWGEAPVVGWHDLPGTTAILGRE